MIFLSFFICNFFSKYLQSSAILLILVIESEKLQQKISDYKQVCSKKDLKLLKKNLVKKCDIHGIVFMIMLTRSSERIFNLLRYIDFTRK